MKTVFIPVCERELQCIFMANNTKFYNDIGIYIVLAVIIRKLEIRGNISTRLKQLSAYTDDVLIMDRTKQTLIDTFLKLKNEALKYGLIVNENKTKYLKYTRKQT
jgi:hypothetical protein